MPPRHLEAIVNSNDEVNSLIFSDTSEGSVRLL